MEREVFVYADLHGTPYLVGWLWPRVRNERESASFEYDRNWLTHPERFSLEPALNLGPGSFHTPQGIPLFGTGADEWADPCTSAVTSSTRTVRGGPIGGQFCAPRTPRPSVDSIQGRPVCGRWPDHVGRCSPISSPSIPSETSGRGICGSPCADARNSHELGSLFSSVGTLGRVFPEVFEHGACSESPSHAQVCVPPFRARSRHCGFSACFHFAAVLKLCPSL